MIRIVNPGREFWRGNTFHANGETFFPSDFFSPENLKLIEEEPRLVVIKDLPPNAVGTMSMDELRSALKDANVDVSAHDPRELLTARLLSVQAEAKQGGESKTKGKKAE